VAVILENATRLLLANAANPTVETIENCLQNIIDIFHRIKIAEIPNLDRALSYNHWRRGGHLLRRVRARLR
jgi:hypothetical protein